MNFETRRYRAALLATAALALSACGDGVDDLELPAAPLAYVRGRLDLASARAEANGRPLRAALVWGASPNYVLACFMFPDAPELQAACPDPYGFVPGALGVDVELPADSDGTFELPIHALPDASVSIGTSNARIAWGSLIVATDADANGAFNLLSVVAEGAQPPRIADPVVAASFVTLEGPQQRLAFREGGWNDGSLFYPAPGCPAPPPGFSTLSAPGVRLAFDAAGRPTLESAPGECHLSSLEGPVELVRLPPDDARELACRSLNRAAVRQPRDRRPEITPAEGTTVTELCLDAKTFAVIERGDCARITVWPLAGCHENLACTKPDWDLTQQPPGWWPCRS